MFADAATAVLQNHIESGLSKFRVIFKRHKILKCNNFAYGYS